MNKKQPKTRPDLNDALWLDWLAAQPENRGICVRDLYRNMVDWCRVKGQTPTRLRLLRWIDGDRKAVPMSAASVPEQKPQPAQPEHRCRKCFDTGTVMMPVPGGRPWELADEPCPDCYPKGE